MASHTIVLVQPAGMNTRTYADFETLREATEGVVSMFESHLKTVNPGVRQINYDYSDLAAFIDSLKDMSCLVFDSGIGAYRPHDRVWIKQKIYNMLRQQLQ